MFWILFVAGGVIAYLATAMTIRIALHRGMLDWPNARSSHSVPVPRMGGLGVLISFFLGIGSMTVLARWETGYATLFKQDVWLIILASVLSGAIGLIDDLYHLRAGTKYLLQFGVVTFAFVLGIRLEQFGVPSFGTVQLGLMVSFPLTVLWLTGFTNVFNFMDGINGMAAGTGAVYGLFFFLFAWLQGSPELAAIAILISGCCVGFMFHNFPEARTFMGDSGSLFLGLFFSLLVVRLAQKSSSAHTLIALILICSVYLFDSSYTVVRRLRHGENIFQAHRSHLYQRLVQQGLSHAKITSLYLILHAGMGSLAVLYAFETDKARLGILLLASIVFVMFTLSVHRIERKTSESKSWGQHDPAPSSNPQDL